VKIVVDARTLIDQPRGVGNYLFNAITALAKTNPNWQFVLVSHLNISNDITQYFEKISNITQYVKPSFFIPKNGLFWFFFKYPFIIKSIKPDVVWAPGANVPLIMDKSIVTLCTVHDLVHKEYKKTMSLKNKIANMLSVDRSITRAQKLWAVSHYTKNLIIKYYPNRKSTDIIVGSSINMELYRKTNVDEQDRLNLLIKLRINPIKKLLLFVGTLEPRKNLKFLLNLMPILAQKDFELIVVGGKGWGNTDIVDIIEDEDYPNHSVRFAGYLSNSELLLLYNVVDCFVSSSINEGFGLPQLEAMACGIPVVAAKNSAIEEVVGNAGILIDNWNPNIWVERIQWAIENKTSIIEKYNDKLKEYDWQLIADRVSHFIEL
jgi:glycosyltransferase involved in cell wall biosynthesis